ncbi:MAG TPA: NUDIX hydrolase [Stellaceae bacterium]|nr:NUDIX hydrolase [Stellaceae bacterium]
MASPLVFDRPRVGILAVVPRDGRFVLVERAKAPAQGMWGFPGGSQELGETVMEAAIRELAEETGIRAGDPQILTVLDSIHRDEAGVPTIHYTLVAVQLRWLEGEGEAADDAKSAGWFGPDDLSAIPALPAVRPLMLQALAALSA